MCTYMANGWMNVLDVAAEWKEGKIYEVEMMKRGGRRGSRQSSRQAGKYANNRHAERFHKKPHTTATAHIIISNVDRYYMNSV